MKITIHEAALLLGGSDAWVRSLCDRGVCGDKWHSVWDFQYHMNPKRFTYVIVPSKLAFFMGIGEEELNERLNVLRASGLSND